LKAVLLHNGNKFPSIPMAHAIKMREMCVKLQVLLHKNTRWRTSVDTLNSVAVYVNGTAEGGTATTE
jgi:hypothetical protein